MHLELPCGLRFNAIKKHMRLDISRDRIKNRRFLAMHVKRENHDALANARQVWFQRSGSLRNRSFLSRSHDDGEKQENGFFHHNVRGECGAW